MQLGDLSWTQAREKTGQVVVLPIGACEQHGHHLPLLTDAMIGAEVARRSAELLEGEAVFLPMLWVGSSDHHLSFPGTVSISGTVYVRVIEDILNGLIEGGFRRIVLLNSHSGNATPARLALNEVQVAKRRELPDLWLALANWFDLVKAPADWRQTKIIHACEWETSAIQVVRPELVGAERPATRGAEQTPFHSPDYFRPARVDVARTIEQASPYGAFGYPEDASPEKGEALYAQATEQFVAFVREFKNYQPSAGA